MIRLDRALTAGFVVLVSTAIVGLSSGNTGASFTGSTTNPGQILATSNVLAPASETAVSAIGGRIDLSWPATTTPPNGHTVTYLVFRNGTQIAGIPGLTYSDTPAADGSYTYVVQTKIAQGAGFFTSPNSPAQSPKSDRTAPAMSATCNGAPCVAWYSAAVTVQITGNDGAGVGMGTATTKIDAAAAGTSASPRSVSVSGAGAHTVVYSGADALGNASGNTTLNVGIDQTAPTAATAIAGAPGQQNGEIDLTWTRGTDGASGIGSQTVRRTNAGTGACPAVSVANYPNVVAGVTAASTAVTATGLVQNSKYCFYIVTADAAGNATNSVASARITAN